MKNYNQISVTVTPGISVGNENFDKFISTDGGLQNGGFIFLTGTPGAGKTTLAKVFQKGMPNTISALYCRESLAKSVQKQTKRVVVDHENAFVSDELDCPHFLDFMKAAEEKNAEVLIVDSLQSVAKDFRKSEKLTKDDSLMRVVSILIEWKNRTNGVVILIGQVNKDGDFSGINEIKHMADCHLHLASKKGSPIRTMETNKNRFGSDDVMYYEFVSTPEVIEIFTEKEFELRGKNIKFDDYLLKVVADFISCVDKKNPSYKEFYAEYKSNITAICQEKEGASKFEVAIVVSQMINELAKKYDL